MRIITGILKGRRFDIPKTFSARPTTDFAKENIFNVLRGYIDFDGIVALDLFAGTGGITLELLSRGCAEVVSVEMNPQHQKFTRQCLEKLSKENSEAASLPQRAKLIRGDALRFIRSCGRQFDFIFADPPYQMQGIAELPKSILESNLLKPNAVFVMEHGKVNDFSALPGFTEHKEYGSVNFSIFRKS